jgi:hypothetical protein
MPRDVQLEEVLLPKDTISRGYVREGPDLHKAYHWTYHWVDARRQTLASIKRDKSTIFANTWIPALKAPKTLL